MNQKTNKSETTSTQQMCEISENGIGNINIQHMTGANKRIENYERMVGNLFVGQTMTPQKVATHMGRTPPISINQNFKR